MTAARATAIFVLPFVLAMAWTFPLFALAADSASPTDTLPANTMKVLFIGNSYTYYNDMPGMVQAMSAAIPGGTVIETAMVAQGMASLRRLWDAGGAMRKIWNEDWDTVVLQESSGLPSRNPERFTEYIRKFDPLIRGTGARTLLFMTWAHQDRPAMYPDNLAVFSEVTETLGIPYAPVGTAWHLALTADPAISLYMEDRTHPNTAGSYLTACVFLHVLLETLATCPLADVYQLSDSESIVIQQAAAQAVAAHRKAYSTPKQ